MRTRIGKRREGALTFVEALAVVAILIILAGLFLPGVPHEHGAKITQAKTEMANLTVAISQYQSEYGTLPVSSNAAKAAADLHSDFTFGTVVRGTKAGGGAGSPLEGQRIVAPDMIAQDPSTPGRSYQNVNSEVLAILTDADYFPENSRSRHSYNLHAVPFFAARPAKDTNSAGLDENYILRDPWGSPYIMTLDLNGDGKCADPVVWQTLYGRAGQSNYTVPGPAMIWSFGPKKAVNLAQPYNSEINKLLITSWK